MLYLGTVSSVAILLIIIGMIIGSALCWKRVRKGKVVTTTNPVQITPETMNDRTAHEASPEDLTIYSYACPDKPSNFMLEMRSNQLSDYSYAGVKSHNEK